MPGREQRVQRPEEAAGEVGVGLECLNSKDAIWERVYVYV